MLALGPHPRQGPNHAKFGRQSVQPWPSVWFTGGGGGGDVSADAEVAAANGAPTTIAAAARKDANLAEKTAAREKDMIYSSDLVSGASAPTEKNSCRNPTNQ